jgi:proline iminopeptidase
LRSHGLVSSSPEMQEATGPYFLPTLFEMFYFYNPENAKAILPFWTEHNFSAEQWNAVAGPDADFIIGGDLGKLDYRPRLESIKVPFLVIAGRHDGIVLPALTLQFKRYAPQAKFVMFEHSGHYPFVEEPSLFVKTVEGFLK